MTILVTGANKGLGYEIAKKFKVEGQGKYGDILVAARNPGLGQQAVKKLQEECQCNDTFVFCQLDLTDPVSRINCVKFIREKYGKLDIIVNNAGFAFPSASKAPYTQQVNETLAINYFGTAAFILDCLNGDIIKNSKEGGRTLICSSGGSDFSYRAMSKEDQNLFQTAGEKMKLAQLDQIAYTFVAQGGSWTKPGQAPNKENPLPRFSNSAYSFSKALIRAFVNIIARDFPDFQFSSYCPGWCKTDLGGGEKADYTTEEGARIAYWLGTSDDEVISKNSGGFYKWGSPGTLTEWGQKKE